MTNQEIYRKTLPFSLRRLGLDILGFLVLGAAATVGFMLAEKSFDQGLIGLAAGLVIGLILLVILLRYVSYTCKAAQIAMMTRGVTEGELPDNVVAAGREAVKERFTTVAVFFAATGVIRGIFNQLGKGLMSLGNAVGGQKGSSAAGAVNSAVQTVIAYLCDCCLGWVFFRRDQNSAKATCEGAVLFFRHGKTLARNLGRIFGMGLVSLLAIGGLFFGIFLTVFNRMPDAFRILTDEMAEVAAGLKGTAAAILSDPQKVVMVCAGLAAVILWSILHSVFVRPYVLIGVLRNYMQAGIKDIPTEASMAALDVRSSKLAALRHSF